MSLLLARLLDDVRYELLGGRIDVPIREVRTDSRCVEPGDVFVCLPGYRTEGGETRADRHEFAPEALARGAVALVVERPIAVPDGTTLIRVDNAWAAAAALADARFGHPSRDLTMIGITGTCGKTSTSYFVAAVLAAAGRRCARFGTIDYQFGPRHVPARQTTPEADELQRMLREAVDADLDTCVMEVSSHALELRRVGGVEFDAAVFTNLSQDHLNFHPDMHAYLRAKGRLFQELASGGKSATAIVNVDDPHADHIVAVNRGALLTYGLGPRCDVRGEALCTGLDRTSFRLATPHGTAEVQLRHLGTYQVHNALAAAGVGIAFGVGLDAIVAGLEAAPTVPGRFEIIDAAAPFRVAVDYAHKPDALARLLESARALNPQRLIVVFGCGGDRDRGKRSVMGRIAAEQADIAIVTADNPRSEDPNAIIDEIVAGMHGASRATCHVEPDRAAAIAFAVSIAGPGDLVVIAGKGHETYQILGDRRIEFDDREHARRALDARMAAHS